MNKSLPRTRRRSSAVVAQPAAAPCNGLQNDDRRIAIEYVATDALRPPARALKKHSQQGLAALRASLRTHGFVRPIVVDGELKIVAGHGLWLAAKALDLPDVPVVRVSHLTPEQLQAFAIADNQIANLNPWDDEALRDALGELNDRSLKGLLDFNLEVTGFATSEIDRLLDIKIGPAAEPTEKGEELLPPADALAVTQYGDLWLLGRQHKLLCGDAREAQSFARLLGDERAQMLFGDPPYNVEIKGNVSGRGKVKHREFAMASGEMNQAQFTAFLGTTMEHCVACSEDGSIHYFCIDWRHMREMLDAGHAHYSELRNVCVWVKDQFGLSGFYRSQHEFVCVWKRGTAKHICNFGGEGGRTRSNIWRYPGANGFHRNREEELAMHSTVKNLSMVADAIRDCSHRGGIILDPYGGSGTTLIAAQKTGRRARLLEIDPLYCDVIVRRWQKLTGETAVLEATGESFAEREARLDAASDGEA